MQHLDVCKKENGKIWHRKPTPGDEGLLLTVTHSAASPLALHSRNVRFLRAGFDVSGERFIAGDHQGNIYHFDIHRNRFSLAQKTGSPCTALAFTLRRKSEFLVAMSDYSLKCFDLDTRELVAWMKGHDSAIHDISLHASGRYALTSSADTGQLWDLDAFQRKRKLNVKENVGIVKVFFLPLSNTIVTCFKDDSIFAWESDTMACKYQLRVPEGKAPCFKTFTTTKDGRYLVAGGRSRFLHVWSLDTRKLHRIVELPQKVTCVRFLEFLPNSFDAGSNQVLGVLSQDGVLRFVDISSCRQLFEVGRRDDRIASVAVSPTGRHLAAVMDSGDLQLYCLQALSAEVNQPPAPLVKVLKSNKMADGDGDTTAGSKVGKKPAARKRGRKTPDVSKDSDPSQTELPEGLNMDKLYSILRGYGEYPTKYRMFIWRSLLRLPENHAAYGALVDKGTHPACERLHQTYPIKSQKLLRVLQRVMSALAHWSPIFGETDYLPLMAFPFVKLFQNNQLVCFEVVATILTNWCQHWFEYFPNPPINVLGVIENVLAHHDRHLLAHLVEHGVTSQIYAWPVLETLFSEVLTREEWLRLFDNVFSNPPAYLLMVVVAYCVANRGPLLKCTEREDFKYFFHHRNAVDVSLVVSEAYRLMESTPDDIHPASVLEDFCPLTRGQYPVYNKYPKFIVDYQVQERERIRQDEDEYLRQREMSLDLQKTVQKKAAEEEAWYRQQQLLLAAEDKRRDLIADEEKKLADQRARLSAMQRELRLKELQVMDAARNKFLGYQQQQKEAELTRLDDEIRRKATLRELETKAAMEEADIKNMELQLQRKVFEQEMFREHMEEDQVVRGENETRRKRDELEDRAAQNVRQAERDKILHDHKAAYQDLAHSELQNSQAGHRNRLEHLHHLSDLERERSVMQVSMAEERNHQLQERIQGLLSRAEDKENEEMSMRQSELDYQDHLSAEAATRRDRILEGEADRARGLVGLTTTDSARGLVGLTEPRGLPDAEPHRPSSLVGRPEDRARMLEREVDRTRGRVGQMERSQDLTQDRLRDLHQNIQHLDLGPRPNNSCINDSDSEYSAQLSLDRGREGLDRAEVALMEDVRRLRQKLTTENRQKRPPPDYRAATVGE